MGFSHIHCSDGLNNTLVSQGCVLRTAPTVGMVVRCTFQGQGTGKEPPIALVQLKGQLVITSSQ